MKKILLILLIIIIIGILIYICLCRKKNEYYTSTRSSIDGNYIILFDYRVRNQNYDNVSFEVDVQLPRIDSTYFRKTLTFTGKDFTRFGTVNTTSSYVLSPNLFSTYNNSLTPDEGLTLKAGLSTVIITRIKLSSPNFETDIKNKRLAVAYSDKIDGGKKFLSPSGIWETWLSQYGTFDEADAVYVNEVNDKSRSTMIFGVDKKWNYNCSELDCENDLNNCVRCSGNFKGINCDICRNNWTGVNCDRCGDNYTGSNCGQCKINFIGPNCENCNTNWTGPNCGQCKINFTGPDCTDCSERWTGPNCTSCKSNFSGANCESCSISWTGPNCSVCSVNFTGSDCSVCKRANRSTVDCERCRDGWSGPDCNVCPVNFTGPDCNVCSNNWKGSGCNSCGLNFDKSNNCSGCTGGWTGSNCTVCMTGWNKDFCLSCDIGFTGYKCNMVVSAPPLWKRLRDIPSGVTDMISGIYGDTIILLGGPNSTNFKYTISTNTWTSIILPVKTSNTSVTLSGNFFNSPFWQVDNFIYIYGRNISQDPFYIAKTYKYNIITNTIEEYGGISSSTVYINKAACWKDSSNNLWMFGGTSDPRGLISTGNIPVNTVYKYTTSTNMWSLVSTTGAPTARVAMRACSIGNTAYLFGGGGTNDFYSFNGGVFTSLIKGPESRNFASIWIMNNVVYLHGGYTSWNVQYNSVWKYDTTATTKVWQRLTSEYELPGRGNSSVVTLNNLVWIMGGETGGLGGRNDMWRLCMGTACPVI